MPSDNFPRERYPHLTDSQFRTLHRMVHVFGDAAVVGLLTTDTDLHCARIDAFRQHEDAVGHDASKAQEATLVTAAGAELDHLRSTLTQEHESIVARLRAEHAETISKVRREKPTPVKLDVSLFEGRDGENISRWFLEVEVALQAALVKEEPLKVAFGMSFLKKKSLVHEWAYTTLLEDQGVFNTWSTFKEKLFAFHQGKHMAHNHRARFLACKQEKRSVYEYVQALRQLSASAGPMDEATKVTILMEGLNVGPVRTQLFREDPKTFVEACKIALEEDNSHKRSGSRKTRDAGGDQATPMDVSSLEVDRYQNMRCYNCNVLGHPANMCRKPRRNGGGPTHTARRGGRTSTRNQRGPQRYPGRGPGNGAARS